MTAIEVYSLGCIVGFVSLVTLETYVEGLDESVVGVALLCSVLSWLLVSLVLREGILEIMKRHNLRLTIKRRYNGRIKLNSSSRTT